MAVAKLDSGTFQQAESFDHFTNLRLTYVNNVVPVLSADITVMNRRYEGYYHCILQFESSPNQRSSLYLKVWGAT